MNTELNRWKVRALISAAFAILLGRLAAQHFGWSEPFVGSPLPGLLSGDAGVGLLAFWAIGHCDGMDGPVVSLARKALDSGDVKLVLPWVDAHDEAEIRRAFAEAVTVRKLNGDAKDLADRYFFETLVRLHRAGEGAPYTGLKPAGRDLGLAVPAADQGLENSSVEAVEQILTDAIRQGLHRYFNAVLERKQFPSGDVDAGRAYVAAYVPYIHYVEHLWQAATGGVAEQHESAHGH